MSIHQPTTKESELAARAQRDAMKRAWMKPRIKRQAGTWVCVGCGTTATGHSPQAAYRVWTLTQQRQVIYAAQAQAFGSAFAGWQC